MKSMKILIADDQSIIREGLATILADQEDIEVVGKARNGIEVVQLVKESQPDVVLLDIQMPVMSGLDALAAIKESHPQTAIIMLTTFSDHDYIYEALHKGASGYVLKDIELEQLIMSIRQCANGQMVFPVSIQSAFMTQMEMSVASAQAIENSAILKDGLQKQGVYLNEREYTLLQLIYKGKSNQQIADELFLSLGTVKNYISQLYRKINVSSRSGLMSVLHRMIKKNV